MLHSATPSATAPQPLSSTQGAAKAATSNK
jgi:hypothetical protein